MTITPINDTVFYVASNGQRREAVGVVMLPGATEAAAAFAPITSTFIMKEASDGANQTLVQAGLIELLSIDAYNARTGGVSILFYDKATAPVVGTDQPRWTVYVPALTPANRMYPTGIRFSTGLAFALVADDASGLMAGDIRELNLGYAA